MEKLTLFSVLNMAKIVHYKRLNEIYRRYTISDDTKSFISKEILSLSKILDQNKAVGCFRIKGSISNFSLESDFYETLTFSEIGDLVNKKLKVRSTDNLDLPLSKHKHPVKIVGGSIRVFKGIEDYFFSAFSKYHGNTPADIYINDDYVYVVNKPKHHPKCTIYTTFVLLGGFKHLKNIETCEQSKKKDSSHVSPINIGKQVSCFDGRETITAKVFDEFSHPETNETMFLILTDKKEIRIIHKTGDDYENRSLKFIVISDIIYVPDLSTGTVSELIVKENELPEIYFKSRDEAERFLKEANNLYKCFFN